MTNDKVRENRARRVADRQGLDLRKSRRRDERALDFGGYWLIDRTTNTVEVGGDHGVSLDDIHAALEDGIVGRKSWEEWKELRGIEAGR